MYGFERAQLYLLVVALGWAFLKLVHHHCHDRNTEVSPNLAKRPRVAILNVSRNDAIDVVCKEGSKDPIARRSRKQIAADSTGSDLPRPPQLTERSA